MIIFHFDINGVLTDCNVAVLMLLHFLFIFFFSVLWEYLYCCDVSVFLPKSSDLTSHLAAVMSRCTPGWAWLQV